MLSAIQKMCCDVSVKPFRIKVYCSDSAHNYFAVPLACFNKKRSVERDHKLGNTKYDWECTQLSKC